MVKSLPIKLLFESKPYIVTIETKNGNRYRGKFTHKNEEIFYSFFERKFNVIYCSS